MFGARVGAGLAPSPARSHALRARTVPLMALESRARTMPWPCGRVKTPGMPRRPRALRKSVVRRRLELRLAPGEGHVLPAVLGHVLFDRILAVEHGARAVGDLDPAFALDDDGPQDPAVAVDRKIALDVDQAAEHEVAVDGEV